MSLGFMKRGLALSILFLLVFSLVFVASVEGDTDVDKVNNAYSCLADRVVDSCSAIPADARAFALLTVDDCKEEIIADKIVSGTDEYWSNSDGQSLKLTAQSILALSSAGVDTEASEKWLLNQNKSPNVIDWFLEIDSGVAPGETVSCTVEYGTTTALVTINEDKTLSFQSGGGLCLSLTASPFTNYFLRISNTQQCLDAEYTISCDSSFLTTFLFKKQGSNTLQVSKETHAESAGGFTTEKIKSLCFQKNQQCDYEGSLWAATVLNYMHYDVSAYMPYLIVMAEDYPEYMPDSFLYSLTSYQEFRTNLLSLQNQQNGYWRAQGTIFEKFYDTAVAGLGLRGETQGVDDAKRYLLDQAQNEDGCWGSTLDTGFLLFAFWENFVYSGTDVQTCTSNTDCATGFICDAELGVCVDEGIVDDNLSCDSLGYYCMSSIGCTGNLLDDYKCAYPLSCCDAPPVVETCEDLGGQICVAGKTCAGTVDNSASDVDFGESCCIGGSCVDPTPKEDSCTDFNGICDTSCDTGYTEDSSYYCPFNDKCCIKKQSSGGSYWWIWILLILIVFVVLGIVFRDRLKILWVRISSRGAGSSSPGGRPPFPPRSPPAGMPPMRGGPRTMAPPQQMRPPMRKPAPRGSGDVDDVLRKLKEMGK